MVTGTCGAAAGEVVYDGLLGVPEAPPPVPEDTYAVISKPGAGAGPAAKVATDAHVHMYTCRAQATDVWGRRGLRPPTHPRKIAAAAPCGPILPRS